MNAIEQARQAYAPTQIAVRTARAVEAQLLTQITTRLRQASEGGLRSFSELASVIHDNRRVWTTLAVSVADRDNQLPSDLRASPFYLADFVERHSAAVLRGDAEINPLIDINSAIIRGLNGQVPV